MRFLLVEDTVDLADAIAKRLQSDGHVVEIALNLSDARTYLSTGDFDLMILDVNLPDGLGTDLLVEAREALAQTPVIILTARPAIDEKIDALDLGADDYVVKPFDLEELVARIRAILRRSLQLDDAQTQMGALKYDANKGQVLIGEEPISLSRTELRLLEIFMRNPGRVFEKSYLIDRLYNLDEDVSPNALELVVSRLRKKLVGSKIEIKTLRGLGYQAMEIQS